MTNWRRLLLLSDLVLEKGVHGLGMDVGLFHQQEVVAVAEAAGLVGFGPGPGKGQCQAAAVGGNHLNAGGAIVVHVPGVVPGVSPGMPGVPGGVPGSRNAPVSIVPAAAVVAAAAA